jgi:uncharacterized protein (DUF433 family)
MAEKRKQRIQLDLANEQVTLMDTLSQQLALRSRADLLQQAFSLFLWAIDETLAGHRIISVESEQIKKIPQYKEVNIPALQPLIFRNYQYLAARPHPWKKQLFLKGRNMTVGQLISTMQANQLSIEEAAEDLDLPVEQIQEALAYYQTHQTLVDLEAREEAARLASKGYHTGDQAQSIPG